MNWKIRFVLCSFRTHPAPNAEACCTYSCPAVSKCNYFFNHIQCAMFKNFVTSFMWMTIGKLDIVYFKCQDFFLANYLSCKTFLTYYVPMLCGIWRCHAAGINAVGRLNLNCVLCSFVYLILCMFIHSW